MMQINFKALVIGLFFILGISVVYAGFEEDVHVYIAQDFPGQEAKVIWDHPDRVQKLPIGVKITDYQNLGGGRIQFSVEHVSHPLSGKVDFLVEVPTLRIALSKASPIRAEDIVMQKISASKLPHGVVLQASSLVGKAPKEHIQTALTPIKMDSLMTPKVVKTGDVLTIVYKSQAMTLTTKGKVLKDAAVGERVPLEIQRNTTSHKQQKKLVDAVVIDADTALIKGMEMSL